VHSLAFKFETVNLDYCKREDNSIADMFAKEAAGVTGEGE